MKNTKFTAFFLAASLLLLPVTLSACKETNEPAAPSSSTAEPTPAPTGEPSSKPESAVKASPDPEPTDAPAQTAGFEEAFAENPIDKQLADELDTASSSSAILKAYETAGKYWKAMVPIAYAAAEEVSDDEGRAQLEQDQQVWEDSIDGIVADIEEKNGDGGDGKITTARQIEERYRETAKILCEIVFSETGELPDFSKAMSDEPVG